MSYQVRVRRGSQSVLADYACDEHGKFEELVIRIDNGEAPDVSPCPVCARPSPWAASSVLSRIKLGEVTRGKSDERPPGCLNTEPLADGVPYNEWAAKVDKETFDMRRKVVRQKMGI